jgi:hypothetical protein
MLTNYSKSMKKLRLTLMVAVFLLICLNEVQAQTVTTNLDQLKLIEQFLGTWQTNASKDTVTVWEFQKFGKAIVANLYNVIKSQKTPYAIVCYGFDSKEGKFKGYSLFAKGNYGTWIALFTTEKKFHVEPVQNFNPKTVSQRVDCVFENPNQWTMTTFNKDGVKVSEVKLYKVSYISVPKTE